MELISPSREDLRNWALGWALASITPKQRESIERYFQLEGNKRLHFAATPYENIRNGILGMRKFLKTHPKLVEGVTSFKSWRIDKYPRFDREKIVWVSKRTPRKRRTKRFTIPSTGGVPHFDYFTDWGETPAVFFMGDEKLVTRPKRLFIQILYALKRRGFKRVAQGTYVLGQIIIQTKTHYRVDKLWIAVRPRGINFGSAAPARSWDEVLP